MLVGGAAEVAIGVLARVTEVVQHEVPHRSLLVELRQVYGPEVGYAGDWTFEVLHGRHGESRDALAGAAYRVAQDWGLFPGSASLSQ